MQLKSALISILLCSVFSARAVACLCVPPATPCGWYATHHGRPTFVGIAVSDRSESDVLNLSKIPVTVRRVRFRIEEAFEGVSDGFVDVYGSGTTCDYHFQLGASYLVYGFRDEQGKIRTSKCTRTAPLSEAVEDLKFLRSLPNRLGGEIIGVVRFTKSRNGAISGTVIASGTDGNHKARVPPSGKYELTGLAPGTYRLTLTLDGDSTEHVQRNIGVPVNGSCAETGVRLGNTTVSGSVIDQTGSPIRDAEVSLSYALDGNFHPEDALRTRTDARGSFTFHYVEAARFVLSAQTTSSPMTFFPSTQDPTKTRLIEVPEGAPLSGLTVRLLSK